MKVVELRAWGLENLVLAERPEPQPGARQVVVRVRAASLNYRDLLLIRGTYNPKQKLPVVPCSDGAGVVVAVGDGVTRFRPGDRVCPTFHQAWIAGEPSRERLRASLGSPLDGTLAEFMLLDEEGLVAIPEYLSDEQAATLPCAAVTAWNALVTEGGVVAGDTVLVQGTGGVSIFALQLGVLLGARVLVTSSSDAKLARAKELGAWELINYKEIPAWGVRARELTGGRGVDHVVEVGGAGTFEQSLQALRPGGTLSLIGVLAGATLELRLPAIQMRMLRVQGLLVGHRDSFEAMNRAIAHHGLRPVVDQVYPLAEARAAFEHLASGAHFGKVVVRI
ncbi:MAG TPA: NAD(P)-dependent alcohol dehydrogenase [Thermoanaerobaculia bacterium]|nr:NAD(P)-dependent alcohol dehydrogenase [Thermoanaerobaculia bacterium]